MAECCWECQHFKRPRGGYQWGHCRAPLPRLVDPPPDRVLLVLKPKEATECPTFLQKTGGPTLSPVALDKLLRKNRFKGRTADAVKLVLLDGVPRAEAARRMAIDRSAVTRMLNKLAERLACPACGRPIKHHQVPVPE